MLCDFRCLLAASVSVLLLAGCSSLPSMGGGDYGGGHFSAGSPVDQSLTDADREALDGAFKAAMQTGAEQEWRGRRAHGAVRPQGYALANLLADPDARIAASRGDLDLSHVMETEQGLHVLTRNSNVRTGPGTDNPVAEMLTSGTGVDVVGRVAGGEWLLVAVDGVVRGYVHKNLAIKAPGTELELAGGPRRKPVLCRNASQDAVLAGQTYEWTSAACNDGAGWRPAPPEISAEAEGEEDDLLGL